ncbi:DUF6083 domain-containing protein [Streptomyces sp. CA-132043]|uniref:DUF6083 domain-containing protein n=1 Tax=Streptomyces sp. CA-132043 TaxID=3240048 RepID=UPI003D8CF494
MGETGGTTGRNRCRSCRGTGPTVRERGHSRLPAVLCDPCWHVQANALAEEEGATAPPRGDPGPDDTRWIEPPACPDCGAPVEVHRTDYDRWVRLATRDRPAKDVPPEHRWRLVAGPGGADRVAVRLRGIAALPSEPVRPAHRAVCPDPDAREGPPT